jgi:hypothetical protein
MKKLCNSLLIATFLIIIVLISCKKDKNEAPQVVKDLYATFKNGEIDECSYNGQTVYSAGLNAYDAGSVIYDKNGKIIGNCNYAYGQFDSICGKLQNVVVIYRCKNHITGEPFVDKYGLDK